MKPLIPEHERVAAGVAQIEEFFDDRLRSLRSKLELTTTPEHETQRLRGAIGEIKHFFARMNDEEEIVAPQRRSAMAPHIHAAYEERG